MGRGQKQQHGSNQEDRGHHDAVAHGLAAKNQQSVGHFAFSSSP
jgi:hypothetical protein